MSIVAVCNKVDNLMWNLSRRPFKTKLYRHLKHINQKNKNNIKNRCFVVVKVGR